MRLGSSDPGVLASLNPDASFRSEGRRAAGALGHYFAPLTEPNSLPFGASGRSAAEALVG
jgi:hypothetical protein